MTFLRVGFLCMMLFFAGGIWGLMGQGSPNMMLLDHVDDHGSYNDCWGYTAPDGREYALLGARNGTAVIDITDAGSAYEVSFFPGAFSTWRDIKTYQNYAYVVNESGGGMDIIDLSDLPNSATLANTYNGFSTSHNIYIDEATGIMLAEGSFGQAVRVISLTDPLNPVQITTFGTECHDVYMQNGFAYISEGFSGSVGIYDMSNPANPQLAGRVVIPSSGYVHNAWLTADGNYMMTTEETPGKTIKMWDISDLGNPDLLDNVLASGGLAHNVHIKGDFAYVSHYDDGLRIYDISDPSNLSEFAFYDTRDAWGAFPFFDSGKILISDIANGLYVVKLDDGSGTPTVDCELTLRSASGGGSISYIMNFTNTTANSVQTQLWLEISGPGGFFETVFVKNKNFNGNATARKRKTYNFPPNVPNGDYTFTLFSGIRGGAVDDSDAEVYTKSAGQFSENRALLTTDIPKEMTLAQNYPNPFNPSTNIRFGLNEAAQVHLAVYNVRGQKIATLVNDFREKGYHDITWNGLDKNGKPAASGIYIYQMTAGSVVKSARMFLMK